MEEALRAKFLGPVPPRQEMLEALKANLAQDLKADSLFLMAMGSLGAWLGQMKQVGQVGQVKEPEWQKHLEAVLGVWVKRAEEAYITAHDSYQSGMAAWTKAQAGKRFPGRPPFTTEVSDALKQEWEQRRGAAEHLRKDLPSARHLLEIAYETLKEARRDKQQLVRYFVPPTEHRQMVIDQHLIAFEDPTGIYILQGFIEFIQEKEPNEDLQVQLIAALLGHAGVERALQKLKADPEVAHALAESLERMILNEPLPDPENISTDSRLDTAIRNFLGSTAAPVPVPVHAPPPVPVQPSPVAEPPPVVVSEGPITVASDGITLGDVVQPVSPPPVSSAPVIDAGTRRQIVRVNSYLKSQKLDLLDDAKALEIIQVSQQVQGKHGNTITIEPRLVATAYREHFKGVTNLQDVAEAYYLAQVHKSTTSSIVEWGLELRQIYPGNKTSTLLDRVDWLLRLRSDLRGKHTADNKNYERDVAMPILLRALKQVRDDFAQETDRWTIAQRFLTNVVKNVVYLAPLPDFQARLGIGFLDQIKQEFKDPQKVQAVWDAFWENRARRQNLFPYQARMSEVLKKKAYTPEAAEQAIGALNIELQDDLKKRIRQVFRSALKGQATAVPVLPVPVLEEPIVLLLPQVLTPSDVVQVVSQPPPSFATPEIRLFSGWKPGKVEVPQDALARFASNFKPHQLAAVVYRAYISWLNGHNLIPPTESELYSSATSRTRMSTVEFDQAVKLARDLVPQNAQIPPLYIVPDNSDREISRFAGALLAQRVQSKPIAGGVQEKELWVPEGWSAERVKGFVRTNEAALKRVIGKDTVALGLLEFVGRTSADKMAFIRVPAALVPTDTAAQPPSAPAVPVTLPATPPVKVVSLPMPPAAKPIPAALPTFPAEDANAPPLTLVRSPLQEVSLPALDSINSHLPRTNEGGGKGAYSIRNRIFSIYARYWELLPSKRGLRPPTEEALREYFKDWPLETLREMIRLAQTRIPQAEFPLYVVEESTHREVANFLSAYLAQRFSAARLDVKEGELIVPEGWDPVRLKQVVQRISGTLKVLNPSDTVLQKILNRIAVTPVEKISVRSTLPAPLPTTLPEPSPSVVSLSSPPLSVQPQPPEEQVPALPPGPETGQLPAQSVFPELSSELAGPLGDLLREIFDLSSADLSLAGWSAFRKMMEGDFEKTLDGSPGLSPDSRRAKEKAFYNFTEQLLKNLLQVETRNLTVATWVEERGRIEEEFKDILGKQRETGELPAILSRKSQEHQALFAEVSQAILRRDLQEYFDLNLVDEHLDLAGMLRRIEGHRKASWELHGFTSNDVNKAAGELRLLEQFAKARGIPVDSILGTVGETDPYRKMHAIIVRSDPELSGANFLGSDMIDGAKRLRGALNGGGNGMLKTWLGIRKENGSGVLDQIEKGFGNVMGTKGLGKKPGEGQQNFSTQFMTTRELPARLARAILMEPDLHPLFKQIFPSGHNEDIEFLDQVGQALSAKLRSSGGAPRRGSPGIASPGRPSPGAGGVFEDYFAEMGAKIDMSKVLKNGRINHKAFPTGPEIGKLVHDADVSPARKQTMLGKLLRGRVDRYIEIWVEAKKASGELQAGMEERPEESPAESLYAALVQQTGGVLLDGLTFTYNRMEQTHSDVVPAEVIQVLPDPVEIAFISLMEERIGDEAIVPVRPVRLFDRVGRIQDPALLRALQDRGIQYVPLPDSVAEAQAAGLLKDVTEQDVMIFDRDMTDAEIASWLPAGASPKVVRIARDLMARLVEDGIPAVETILRLVERARGKGRSLEILSLDVVPIQDYKVAVVTAA